jgi:hypothetical protein
MRTEITNKPCTGLEGDDMGSMEIGTFATTKKPEISRATHIRRDLLLSAICLLTMGLLIFTAWQQQVTAFHLSIQEYAESLEAK